MAANRDCLAAPFTCLWSRAALQESDLQTLKTASRALLAEHLPPQQPQLLHRPPQMLPEAQALPGISGSMLVDSAGGSEAMSTEQPNRSYQQVRRAAGAAPLGPCWGRNCPACCMRSVVRCMMGGLSLWRSRDQAGGAVCCVHGGVLRGSMVPLRAGAGAHGQRPGRRAGQGLAGRVAR